MLTDAKQTISTDVLYYDRVKNTAYFNSGEPLMMEEIPCGLSSATYFIDSKTNEFTNNYTY